jgi:hypothetical protein
MDQRSAIKLLDDTFNKDFDVNQYTHFVKELFNNFALNPKSWSVWKEYQDYIDSYQLLGSYKDSSKKIIDVLVVKLKKASSRDRARTMQRNFIAKYLGNAEKDSALVAFYGDDPQDWRFSFVKMEYNLVKDESGKVKPQKELTPAKRYSFLVGVNEPNHTCRRQFLKLIMEEDVSPSLKEIENSFSIDNVTKEFFLEYKELFLKLRESLENVISKDKHVKEEFEERNISTVDFAKKLLGQIVFIYFLQKKGWLGVVKNDNGGFEKWGTGPKNFLRRLFDKEIVHYDNFFNDILEPLFYEALATERDDDYYRLFECKIPFLNGGLFEPINDYDWAGTEIVLDNSIFGTIFSVFDRFNFTVKEDEPLEKEVAVDPEMLGKVFENLLDVIDRKSKGAFYTPREIVHYMCQQSLINYLETNISISREDIEKFIQLGDFATSNDERVLEEIRSKQDKLNKGIINALTFDKEVKELINQLSLPKSIVENKEKIDDLLKNIKVVDPAVGSGAFPVGMLNEIVKARSTLSIFLNKQRNEYDLKREIIENCLYGVDIESSAVDITKLRFWLSLIVDELDMKNIKPLPNLDHKIMCGNSLLEEFEGKKLFDEKLLGETKRDFAKELKEIGQKIRDLYNDYKGDDFEKELKKLERERKKIETEAQRDRESSQATLSDSISRRIKESQVKLKELKSLQQKFFNEQNRKLKKQYRDQIDKLEWDLIEETLKEEGNQEAIEKLSKYKKNKSKPFFLWKLYFAEVFQRENPGFDVVIANPPYIRIHKQDKEYKEQIKRNYYSAFKDFDIYILFFEKSLNILRANGVMTYITPDKYLIREYGSRIRELILNNTIVELFDISRAKDIFDAATYPLISIIMKSPKDGLIKAKFARTIKNINQDYDEMEIEHKIAKENNLIELIHPDNKIIIDKIYSNSKVLSDIITKNQIFCGTPRAKDYHAWQKYITTEKNVKNSLRLLVCSNLTPYHINIKKKVRTLGLLIKEPYFVNEPGAVSDSRWKDFSFVPKILFRGNDTRITAVLDNVGSVFIGVYGIKAIGKIKENYKFLLALLNSKLYQWVFAIQNPSVKIGGDFFSINSPQILRLPYKENPSLELKIIALVDQILSITKDDDYLDNPDKKAKVKRLEKEIDQLVYKLYDLILEEIKIVEEFNRK